MPYKFKGKKDCTQSDGSKGKFMTIKKDGSKRCYRSEKQYKAAQAYAHESDSAYGEEINEDIARILVKDFTNRTIKESLPPPSAGETEALRHGFDPMDALYASERKPLTPEEQIKVNKNLTVSQVVFRAIGFEIEKLGFQDFKFSPPATISGGKGIRINPKNEEAPADELLNKVFEIIDEISWLEVDTSVGGGNGVIEPGLSGSPSGKFTSIGIKTIDDLMNSPSAKDFKFAAFNAMQETGADDGEVSLLLYGKPTRKNPNPNINMPQKSSLLGKFARGKLTDKFFVVINSKSLANKLFTTGITDVAEYAVGAAILGQVPNIADAEDVQKFISSNEMFKKCVTGNITKPSWAGAAQKQRVVFAKTYVNMVTKLNGLLSKLPADVDFGNKLLAVGGVGGAAYDVMTNTANIHVKFDESGSMSRLAGIQKEKSKSDDAEEVKEKVKAALKVNASHRWQETRDAFLTEFQELPGVPPLRDKDTAWLAEVGFYSWLVPPHNPAKVNKWLDSNKVPPDHKARTFITQPPGFDIIKLMKNAITREFLNPGAGEEGDDNKKKFFYVTFFDAKDDVEASVGRIKIEQLGFGSEDELEEFSSNIEIGMHPSYADTQTTRPFAMFTSGNNNQTYLEFEFRNSDSSKPIQVHRGDNFSLDKDSEEKSIARVLVNENIIKNFLREALDENDLGLNLKLIIEELTGADKSEIKRMIAKEIEGASNKRETKKIFQAEFNKELKKALGTSFIGEPGKINKFVGDTIQKEVEKMFKDKATQNEIGEITKAVIKKLYRELSYSSVHIVDRIKL